MNRSRATATKRRPRNDVIGVTSDGVRILRQVKGPRNLTDAQVKDIVDELVRIVRAEQAEKSDANGP